MLSRSVGAKKQASWWKSFRVCMRLVVCCCISVLTVGALQWVTHSLGSLMLCGFVKCHHWSISLCVPGIYHQWIIALMHSVLRHQLSASQLVWFLVWRNRQRFEIAPSPLSSLSLQQKMQHVQIKLSMITPPPWRSVSPRVLVLIQTGVALTGQRALWTLLSSSRAERIL